MKRITALLAAALVAMPTATGAALTYIPQGITAFAAEETGTYTTYNVTSYLNIRSKADVSSSILGTIPAGAEFEVTAFEGKWAYASYGDVKGYVSTDYIKLKAQPPAEDPVEPAKSLGLYTTYNVTSYLNIRSKADVSASVLGTIPAGAEFSVSSVSGNWALATYNGVTGYVNRDYIVFSREEPDISIAFTDYPDWFTPKGYDGFKGTIISKSAITNVHAEVLNAASGESVYSVSVVPENAPTEYDISKLVGEGLDFASLTEGKYSFSLSAETESGINTELLSSSFAVMGAADDYGNISVSDINRDGEFSVADTVLLEKYLLGSEKLAIGSYINADLNRDMSVDSFDLVKIRQLLVLELEKQAHADDPVMLNVMEYNQHPSYPTGCESAALYMLLKYYGTNVTMEQIVTALPKGPLPYWSNGTLYGANPEKEFVGDPRNNYSYGVFNEPMAQTANVFRSGAITKKGATVDDIVALLNKGIPVMAWYTTSPDKPITYVDSWYDYQTGELVRWPRGEHAIVVCGHDKTTITYRDPNTGSSRTMSTTQFSVTFNELGGRILYYNS